MRQISYKKLQPTGKEYFDDNLGEWEFIYDLARGMADRSIKLSPKNRYALIASIKQFLKENSFIDGNEKFLYGISLNALINRLMASIDHPNRPIKGILIDIIKIFEKIREKHLLRLETFEEFSDYIIKHRLITSNKKMQRVIIAYSDYDYDFLKYGFYKQWDLKLVKKLIKMKRKTDDFEVFRAWLQDQNKIVLFYRFYEDNLLELKDQISFSIFPDKNELEIIIPLYKAQAELFESEIKAFAKDFIENYYKKTSEKEINARPIIKELKEVVQQDSRVLTEIKMYYYNLDEDADKKEHIYIKKNDGFDIIL